VKHHLRTPLGRLIVGTLTALVAAAMLVSVAMAEAGDGISATGATVDRVGWWHEKNVGTSTPAGVTVTAPPPPGVPAGTLAVGAFNGEPDRITAIGILPDAVSGDSITSFTLSIKEAAAPAAGFNGEAAKIVACPITSFWVAAENGTWDTRPTYDCNIAQAPGTRGADGTWTFDLLPIGQLWVDPAGSVPPDGIVLVEQVESPDGFQTVFATSGEGALVVSLAFEPGSGSADDPFGDSGAFEDLGSFDTGDASFDSPSIGSSDIPVGGLPAPDVATPEAGATPQDAPAVAPATIASESPNVLGNLPGGLALAVPLFLVLLGLLSYSLGPAGEPAIAGARRQGGVSRALAARARADATSHPMETL
jgi:hypothetical protein